MASEHDQEAFLKALGVVTSLGVHNVITSLCQLNVFDIMMQKAGLDGYVGPDEIAADLAAKNADYASDMLDRMLRLLASHSFIRCKLVKSSQSDDLFTRSYGLTPVSHYFVRNKSGPCLFPYQLFVRNKEVHTSWYCMKDAILEGGVPFNRAHEGSNFFEYLEKNKELGELMSQMMSKSIGTSMNILLDMYNGFEGMKEVVDVGGALGATSSCIVSKYPNIKGINFDQPHVVQNAPSLPGVTHIGGDMFESVPSGEAILVQRVLHDWNDEDSVKILKKCHEALPESGKAVIIDMILTDLPESDVIGKNTYQMDIGMLLLFDGGRERTAKEFQILATKAGFAGTKLVCKADLYGVIECYKNI